MMSHSPWLESRTRAVTVVALLGLCGLLVGGCASTAIQAQWADPQFAGRSLRGATVLVVCDASATAIKRLCQDQIAARLAASAIKPVVAPDADSLPAEGKPMPDKIFAAARRARAAAIWASLIAPDVTADMTLTDVATRQLIWTSRITTPASQDITEQVTELVEVGVKSARQAGFL
jgi:hypothetical protein